MRHWTTARGFLVRAVVIVWAAAPVAPHAMRAVGAPSAGVLRAIHYRDRTYYYRLLAAGTQR
ncbi:MAG TPA: hypothetical protein VF395_11780 [Polyangiaceae bacterium]